ncbi:type II secretion system F family protein [Luedemannella flava]|uniref:Type II secretion system F family protein n=1 Tax=Luedemannella flava TaxID=349316 RepID=A0ABN2LE55_9ACTN
MDISLPALTEQLSIPAPPRWAALVAGAVVFVALILLVIALIWPRSRRHERIKQIAQFGPARTLPTPTQTQDDDGNALSRTALKAAQELVRVGGNEAGIALKLERAGMGLRPHEWVLVRGLSVIGGAVLGLFLVGWIGMVLGMVLGALIPMLYQSIRVSRRGELFAEQLPEGLQLVVGSLRSGFSLPQALDSLVRETPEPLSQEFGRALTEYRLGGDLADALERVAARTGNRDLTWALMAVRIQREVGGNLAEVLQTAVETMRERGRLRRHVRSLSAEGRLSAYVLIGLPIVLAVFMFLTRRDYLMPLFTDPLGVVMLLVGVTLLVAGIFWIVRVVKVEV